MLRKIDYLSHLLPMLPIDTTYEQSLLAASLSEGSDIFLVCGTQDAQIFSLLPLETPLFQPHDFPLFPVDLEYGPSLVIAVTDKSGQTEKYHSVEDFHHFCAHCLTNFASCTVKLPEPLLQQTNFRFLLLNDPTFDSLNRVGKGVTGSILVVSADAGALSDDYSTLCDWLVKQRCISDRVSMILNQRAPVSNPMLTVMAEQMLQRNKIAVFTCGRRRTSPMTPQAALNNAARDLLDRTAGSADEGVFQTCCQQTLVKLVSALKIAEEESEMFRCRYESCIKAKDTFHAMALTEGYSFTQLLKQEEQENIRSEIRGMFTALKAALPALIQEVKENSQDPKEDLKQLAGDYLGDLINEFTSHLLSEVSEELLIPRANKRFHDVFERFQRLTQDDNIQLREQDIAHAEAEFLRMTEVNMGNYHTQTAKWFAALGEWTVKAWLFDLDYGFASFTHRLTKILVPMMENFVDAVMPTGLYTRNMLKDILSQLDETENNLCSQLDETVFPRLYRILHKEFTGLTNAYGESLWQLAEEYRLQKLDADKQVSSLNKSIKEVKNLQDQAN